MTRRQIVLHIGAHKTGTTALQQYFFEHRKELGRAGILYPSSGTHHFAQHRLAFALRGKRVPGTQDLPELDTEAGALLEEISGSPCPQVFLSSEEFFSLPVEAIGALRTALAGHDVRVLAVLRRPDELFASLYNQKVKETRNRFALRHSALVAHPARLSPDMCFDVALRGWSSVFGEEAVAAHCIEQHPNAVALASRTLGYEPGTRVKDLPRRNVSVAVRTAEALRLGKQAGMTAVQLQRLRDIAGKAFGTRSEGESLLSPQERMQILRDADAMTEHVFERYVHAPNVYASHRFREADFPARTVLQAPDLMKIVAALIPDATGR